MVTWAKGGFSGLILKIRVKQWPVRPEAERENEVLRAILEMILHYQLRYLLQKVFLSSYPMALFLTYKQDLGKFK